MGISQSEAVANVAPVFGALLRARPSPFVAQGIASRALALLQVILASKTVDEDEKQLEEQRLERDSGEEGGPDTLTILEEDSLGR